MQEPFYDVEIPAVVCETAILPLAEIVDYGARLIAAPEAWRITEGQRVRVGILDTGCEPHEDLGKGLRKRGPTVGGDPVGHGTHVAGIIGARANDVGIRGIAPRAWLYSYRAVPGTWEAAAEGLRWLVARNVDIVNMSFGGSNLPSKPFLDAVEAAYLKGVILVASAGNTRKAGVNTISYPARLPQVIPVAAIGENAAEAPFSATGDELQYGYCMPGVQVLSTWLDNGYARVSGTSMAAPHLSGVIALMLSKHKLQGGATPIPARGPERVLAVREHLDESARAVGDPKKFGRGYIDAKKLLNA